MKALKFTDPQKAFIIMHGEEGPAQVLRQSGGLAVTVRVASDDQRRVAAELTAPFGETKDFRAETNSAIQHE